MTIRAFAGIGYVECEDGNCQLYCGSCEIKNTVEQKQKQEVDHPDHYGGDTTYEVIKVIDAWGLGFSLGNSVKYIARAGKKSPDALTDLRKAMWYLNHEIALLEKKDHGPNSGS